MIKIYLYTLEIAFCSMLIAVTVGLVASYFTTKKFFPGRKFLLATSIVPLCVPALIIALGYVGFWGVNGTASKFIPNVTFLYSTAGIIIAQGFYNFPLVTSIITDAWGQLPQENENAARMLGAKESRILFTITLPRLKGAIAAACIPVFLYCFFSFMIVLLFSPAGHSTIEVEIFHAIRSTLDVKSAAGLAVLETATSLSFVLLYSFITRKSQLVTNTDGVAYIPVKKSRIKGFSEIIVFTTLVILVCLFFFCPLCSIIKSSFSEVFHGHKRFSLIQYKNLFTSSEFKKSVLNSLTTGFFTGWLCVVVAFVYSICVKLSKHQHNAFLQTIPLIPMSISSVVLAWVFGLIFHRGNRFLLVIMETILFWPIAYRQLQNGLNRISSETDKAAILFSKNKFDAIIRVYLPSCLPLLLSAFCYCFALSIGDSTLPLVLSIPKFNTLALYTYRLAASYRFNLACATGIFMTFLCILFQNIKSVI